MTKITQFSKPAAKSLSAAVMRALIATAAEHGVSLNYRGGKFDDNSFTFKIEAIVEGGSSQRESQEIDDFKFNAPYVGLKADDFGKTITLDGKTFTIAGFRSRAGKKPISLKCADGKMYSAPVDLVKLALARAE